MATFALLALAGLTARSNPSPARLRLAGYLALKGLDPQPDTNRTNEATARRPSLVFMWFSESSRVVNQPALGMSPVKDRS